ncbi:hypothetical protein E2C01_012779 [Portunus trituberculatus]|uniref:Uncharacterized protein n=1 Tax=Portunus trituberculatus TaxID=210409 RepID=A0A5B7DEX4_PORTR|nr:hypothetical protein [Portunus trituberculatus]
MIPRLTNFHYNEAVPIFTVRFHETILKSTCLHPVRVHPRPLGVRRVTLPAHCASIEVHLPTQVLGQTLSPRKGPPQTLGCEESNADTSLRLTRVSMSMTHHAPLPNTVSESFSPLKGPLVHGAQRALVHGDMFSWVSL